MIKQDAAALREENIKLRMLLAEASNAIEGELDAAGPDEVKQHPTYRRLAKLVNRIDKALAPATSGPAGGGT